MHNGKDVDGAYLATKIASSKRPVTILLLRLDWTVTPSIPRDSWSAVRLTKVDAIMR